MTNGWLMWVKQWNPNHPMTGNGKSTPYENGDDWGMLRLWQCFNPCSFPSGFSNEKKHGFLEDSPTTTHKQNKPWPGITSFKTSMASISIRINHYPLKARPKRDRHVHFQAGLLMMSTNHNFQVSNFMGKCLSIPKGDNIIDTIRQWVETLALWVP